MDKKAVEVLPKKLSIKPAIVSESDAGGGYVIGYNAYRQKAIPIIGRLFQRIGEADKINFERGKEVAKLQGKIKIILGYNKELEEKVAKLQKENGILHTQLKEYVTAMFTRGEETAKLQSRITELEKRADPENIEKFMWNNYNYCILDKHAQAISRSILEGK